MQSDHSVADLDYMGWERMPVFWISSFPMMIPSEPPAFGRVLLLFRVDLTVLPNSFRNHRNHRHRAGPN